MHRRWLRASLPGVLAGFMVGSLGSGGCTPSGTQEAAQAVADPALQQLLQHVPADTPYALISMGGGGMRDFMAKIYGPLAPMMKQAETTFAGVDLQRELGLADDKYALLKAVVDEFKGKLSVDGMAELGLDIDARFAFYGIGMLPAMRWQLRDPAALRGTLERIQTNAGTRFPLGKLGEVEYWQISGNGYEGAVAIVGDQLVAGVAPAAQRDKVFALLLGSERPARHLGSSEVFQQMLVDHGLAKISAGFIDARIIAEAFLGEGDALNRDTLAAISPSLATKWPDIDDNCKQEIRSLVALAPRMVVGTEQIDGNGFSGKFVLELRPDVAQDLKAMRASVPGLDSAHTDGAVLAMGAGLDMERALAYVADKAAAITAMPYTCPDLADLNRAASEVPANLKDLPAPLQKARGFGFVAEDVKLAGFLPSDVKGYTVVASGDTQGLLGLLRALPLFTTHAFTDDGTVTTLTDGAIPFLTNVSYGARAGQGVVFAVGGGSKERVGELLGAAAQTDPPLMVAVYDMGRMGDLMGQAMGSLGSNPPEMQALLDFYKAFGAVTYDVRAGDRGIIMNTKMTLR